MNKIYVFDLGGTLMEYKGMPLNWSDFYVGGFSLINQRFNLGLSKTQIDQAVEILKSHNPRICGRQNEILATDLPSGMPDSIFKPSITELLPYFDLYVSSEVCGFRKPNKAGLEFIANHFNVPVTDLIFIGDEQKDIDCATNANCKFVHISKIIKL